MASSFLYVFQRIYLLIASVLLADTWVLQSKSDGGRHKKKFLWFLILLLPFLLFGGAYYFLDPPSSSVSLKQMNNFVDSLQIDLLKNYAFDTLDSVKMASSACIDSVKGTTNYLVDEAHKLWNENFSRS